MKIFNWVLTASILLGLLAGCAPAAEPLAAAWPAQAWASAAPEKQGMDSAVLAGLFQQVQQKELNLRSLLVSRNGTQVAEAYFDPYQAGTSVRIQSITKSVIGMLVGIAIDRGLIPSVDQPVLGYFSHRLISNLDANKQAMTLKHLLTMTSGFACADPDGTNDQMLQTEDWAQFMLDLKMADAPGTTFRYCSGNAHLLSVILEKASGMTAREFANRELFAPLGIAEVPAKAWAADPQGHSDGSSGLYLTPQEIARLGLLYVNRGQWAGKQVVPASWVDESLKAYTQKVDGSSYGYLWTVYPAEKHYAALGLGGQQLHIYPEQKLVVTLTAGMLIYDQVPEVDGLLKNFVLPSVKSQAALADNPAALQKLQTAISGATSLRRPVPALPPLAAAVSDKAFVFEPNPNGYKKLALVFQAGSPEAQLKIDDLPPAAVGLDHLYRASMLPTGQMIWLRGSWADAQTFVLEQSLPGELADFKVAVTFSGGKVSLDVSDAIFGRPMYKMHGRSE